MTLLDELHAEPYYLPGHIHTSTLRLTWTTNTLTIRHAPLAGAPIQHVLTPDDTIHLQVSKTLTPSPWRRLTRLFRRRPGRTRGLWHVEIRHDTIGRLQLSARVPDGDRLEGLPTLDMRGVTAPLDPLRHLVAMLRGWGAEMTLWTEAPVSDLRSAEGRALVHIATFNFAFEAQIALAVLEGNDIEGFIFDAHTVALDPSATFALGGVKLNVRARDARRALDALAQAQATDDTSTDRA